jgi:hypothetical protein
LGRRSSEENPRSKEFIDPGGLVVIQYQNGVKGIVSQIEDGSGTMSVEINLTGARVRINEKFDQLEVVTKDSSQVAKPGKPIQLMRVEHPVGVVSQDIFELIRSVLLEVAADVPLKCDAIIGRQSF